MKYLRPSSALLLFIALVTFLQNEGLSQTFQSVEKAKSFFLDLDDKYNVAMTTKDSVFFAKQFSEKYINETPMGTLNNKREEIRVLIDLAPTHVTRVAPQFDIFTYSCEVATLSVVKKLTMKDSSHIYVRRTIVHQLINGKWQMVSGQGTVVQPKVIELTSRK